MRLPSASLHGAALIWPLRAMVSSAGRLNGVNHQRNHRLRHHTIDKPFAYKGLEKFFLTGSKAGIQPAHADKLARQLAILNVATALEAMDQPGWKLHGLMGGKAGHWPVWVNGNWRLTFKFSGEDAEVVE